MKQVTEGQQTLASLFDPTPCPPPEVEPEDLTPLLGGIERLLGSELTARFTARFGGVRLYIPQKARLVPGHPIVQTLGLEAAHKLAADFGGLTISVPKGDALARLIRDAKIRERSAQGLSAKKIAREFGLTERHVTNILGRK